MKSIPIDQDEHIDLNAIASLQVDDLKEWISRRFAGNDPYFSSGSYWAEEDPKSVFIWAWKQTDPASPYRERLAKALNDLLEPALMAPQNVSMKWLYQLLALIAMLKIKVDAIKLKQAFESSTFDQAPFLQAGIDQALLSVLAAQRVWIPPGPEFWRAQLKNPRYARTAIRALRFHGLEEVARALPDFLETFMTQGEQGVDKISSALIDLVESYDTVELKQVFRGLPQESFAVVEKALERYKISFASLTSNNDFEKLKKELLCDLSQEWRVVLEEVLKSYIISKDEIERKIVEASITAKIMGLNLDEQDSKKSARLTTSTENPRRPFNPAASA
ncbi:MAG: hypothetical protein ACRENG_11400 [bacterium]